ncbi:DUF302 domain-containing protein [Nocardia sp. 004]|uniref:DUF302 domain-containing protein n=1 Tax=Nocardia sp. 004 TaxID=3385978 RepID=UPI0039A2AD05
MSSELSVTLRTTFDDAVERTRAALAEQGFGVLTDIDIRETMKTRLDADIEDYRILGACNPPLAYRALDADRQIGLLLPCNVVVRRSAQSDDTVLVEAMNPQLMVEVTGEPALRPIAVEATAKLRAAIDALRVDVTCH